MRCAFGQTLPDRTPLELLKIFVAWRKNDTGFALSVLFDKGPAIGLHRPVEGIELRVLAETFGIDAGRLRIGVGPDNLRLLVALRADGGGFQPHGRPPPLAPAVERRPLGPLGQPYGAGHPLRIPPPPRPVHHTP